MPPVGVVGPPRATPVQIFANFGEILAVSPPRATVLARMAAHTHPAGSLGLGVLSHALAHAWAALGAVIRALYMPATAFTKLS